jgi:hypothetical protein
MQLINYFKKINILILILFSNYFGLAQNPVIPIENDYTDTVANAYYKDFNQVYNSFEGTWLYQNGNTSLTIKLIKKESMLVSNYISCYSDFLIGEVKYVKNGIERLNTLNNLAINHIDYSNYNLYSVGIIENDRFPSCNTCPPDTKRVSLMVDEPTNDDFGISAIMALEKGIQNSLEVIKMKFILKEEAKNMNKNNLDLPSVFRNFTIPYGEYILVKQP